MTTRYIKNQNCFVNDMHWTTCGLRCERRNPPEQMFLSENVILQVLKFSLCHFGQHVLESPVSQLQNGASTSSLPPFIVDLLTFKVYPRFNSFFKGGFGGC